MRGRFVLPRTAQGSHVQAALPNLHTHLRYVNGNPHIGFYVLWPWDPVEEGGSTPGGGGR